MPRSAPLAVADFPYFSEITTRWMDNDVYGHVNNAVYYSFFDTAVSGFLVARGAVDFTNGVVVGLAVESRCEYFKPISFPDTVRAGVRIGRLGTTSVRYEVGIFRNDEDSAAAQGHFVHVYVERASGRPVPLPAALKAALASLVRS